MERIRATQQKMLRPLDKQTHFDGKFSRKYRLLHTGNGEENFGQGCKPLEGDKSYARPEAGFAWLSYYILD